MRSTRGLLALLCCLLGTASAPAQKDKPLPVMPPGGFRFTGTWDCAGMFRNAKVHKSTFTGVTTLADKWLQLTEQDVEPATGYIAEYLIGYDPQQERLVEFDANNFGAATYSSDTGWQSDSLTMTSPVSQDRKGTYAANRFLYSIKGQNTFTVDWQISKTAALDWVQADHLACQRRPG